MSDAADGWRRVPGEGKYACREIERRFLVRSRPPEVVDSRHICDRYITGTRLRLRRTTVGADHVWKLTQKVRRHPDDPYDVAITNIYLDEAEYDVLAQLPAATLTKTRGVYRVDGVNIAVDVFHGQLHGLVLAEIDIGDDGEPATLPAWIGPDVSHDDRYSGGALATASAEDVMRLSSGA